MMATTLPALYLDAVAVWAPTLSDWAAARAAFRGAAGPLPLAAARPAPALLPPAERRRAPDTVALALEVAAAATQRSGHAPHELLSVFSSCHGDLAITDAMCRTLASNPALISPTRFHNSVHNAASGYWGIATGCRQASTAVSAYEHSFAAGLLEALTQAAAEARPVLLVGVDTAASGPLASLITSRGLLAVALVIAPTRGPATLAVLDWSLVSGATERIPLRCEAALPLATNAMADALPVLEALAAEIDGELRLPLNAALALRLRLSAFGQGPSGAAAY